MIHVYKDPEGLRSLEKSKNRSTVYLDKKGVFKVVDDEETIESLYKQVDQLETAIEAKKVAVFNFSCEVNN